MTAHHENVVSNLDIGVRFYQSLVKSDGYVPFHWHSSIELVCVLEGKLVFNFEGKQHIIGPNRFVVVSSGVVHDVANTPNHAFVLQIPIKFVQNYYLNPEQLHFITENLEGTTEYKKIIKWLHELNRINQREEKGYLFDAEILVLLIVKTLFLRFVDNQNPFESKMSGLKEILIFIESHYNQKISVAEIAKKYGYNASYLSRLFKEQTGITLVEYIYEVRLSNLYNDLVNTKLPITVLLNKHGLTNRRTAREMCKKMFGLLPSQIRQKYSSEVD
ncbi:AraC family transcriptional regulator [Pediococcus acidilactici]|uniref:AraC family transcriptional regulator n=1 Tax=Pediococcus acidilactici TaxID=1254 RepID=UPI001F4DFB10|nr:AraC family transcriptional regulator [Pediococcus acidilactici]MCH9266973.1 helix-turn-helix domain-containing protein [Pediococcus acidilactici]MCK2074281.1 helix-turn-helix domain-containing protein [Pediococcus acidilactici]